jgi:hypothetical protein
MRGRYHFCGTIRNRVLANPIPWRYQARRPAESGLSSGQSSRKKLARDRPICPPRLIIKPRLPSATLTRPKFRSVHTGEGQSRFEQSAKKTIRLGEITRAGERFDPR